MFNFKSLDAVKEAANIYNATSNKLRRLPPSADDEVFEKLLFEKVEAFWGFIDKLESLEEELSEYGITLVFRQDNEGFITSLKLEECISLR